MLAVRLPRSTFRHWRVWYLALSLLVVQGLGVHFHAFADHESLHGHGHEIELHLGDVPGSSDHDDVLGESGFAKQAILKIKSPQANSLALAVVITGFMLAGLALAGHVPWRPGRLFSPTPGGDVYTPPLRAPPL